MEFTLTNVANIRTGTFKIEEGKLNIFYALNGTGKTSLTSAIQLSLATDLKEIKEIKSHLTPYDGSGEPDIHCDKTLSNVLIFNEEYINRNLFSKGGDALRNTFEIVVNTPDYERRVNNIERMLERVTNVVSCNDFISMFHKDIDDIDGQFMMAKTGQFNSRTSGFAQLNKGLVTKRVPETNALRNFVVDSLKAGDWKKWFDKGSEYVDDSNRCPYCGAIMSDESIRDQNELRDICETKEVEKSLEATVLIHTLTKYLTREQTAFIEGILASGNAFDTESIRTIHEWFVVLKEENDKIAKLDANDIDGLLEKVRGRRLADELTSQRLDIDVFRKMDFIPNAASYAEAYNVELSAVIMEAGRLSDELDQLSRVLRENIENNQAYVNKFLENAGMPYKIEIYNDDGEYKTILRPCRESSGTVAPKKNLSYGEMNALSLLLFSLDVRKQDSDLIILDDPISSFDNSKKFALMHQMFGDVENQTNLRGRTVLMVTHDFSIVADTIKKNLFGLNYKDKNTNQKVILARSSYLRNKEGVLTCTNIDRSDIKIVTKIEKSLFKNTTSPKICRMIHFRKYLEISGDMDDHKYNLVSSWLHGDEEPTLSHNQVFADKDEMIAKIKEIEGMEDFDYKAWLAEQTDDKIVETYQNPERTNIEKLEIVRFYLDKTGEDKNYDRILMGYLNSACHIEGDLVVGLDQNKFETMPPHVIAFCDEIIAKIRH
ncbi:MAG: hypothetical protein MJ238_04750 [Bacilli bacterium]|nr:hypothetical protein [Bacilli bacterium]